MENRFARATGPQSKRLRLTIPLVAQLSFNGALETLLGRHSTTSTNKPERRLTSKPPKDE